MISPPQELAEASDIGSSLVAAFGEKDNKAEMDFVKSSSLAEQLETIQKEDALAKEKQFAFVRCLRIIAEKQADEDC